MIDECDRGGASRNRRRYTWFVSDDDINSHCGVQPLRVSAKDGHHVALQRSRLFRPIAPELQGFLLEIQGKLILRVHSLEVLPGGWEDDLGQLGAFASSSITTQSSTDVVRSITK